jgi:membrane protease YdiL (CAAX protease family)
LRWWDGTQWTAHEAHPAVENTAPTFPLLAAFVAVVVLYASLVAANLSLKFLSSIHPFVGFFGPIFIAYGPSVAFCIYVHRRWRSVASRRSLRPRFSDLGWGPLVWFSGFLGQLFLVVLIKVFEVPSASNVPPVTEENRPSLFGFWMITIVAAVIAPLFEEFIFRGTILPALRSKMSPWMAIPLQGLFFGLAHVQWGSGKGNIGLVLIITWVGMLYGVAASNLRRIWPTIIAHAMMNGLVMFLQYGQYFWDWKL